MNEERALAVLRAAERLGQNALRWLPYPDDVADHLRAERDADDILIQNDLALIRSVLAETEFAILNNAERAGSVNV